jgi:hypothetical protein
MELIRELTPAERRVTIFDQDTCAELTRLMREAFRSMSFADRVRGSEHYRGGLEDVNAQYEREQSAQRERWDHIREEQEKRERERIAKYRSRFAEFLQLHPLELRHALSKVVALAGLSARDRRLLKQTVLDEMTVAESARRANRSRERIRQVIAEALRSCLYSAAQTKGEPL